MAGEISSTFMSRLISLFLQDVQNDNETKKTAVLIRVFSSVAGIYFVLQTLIFGITHRPALTAMAVICLFGNMLAFYLTYRNHTFSTRLYLIALTLIWIIGYVGFLGWDLGVQHFLFMLLVFELLTSYSATIIKVLMAAGLCGLRIILYVYSLRHVPAVGLSSTDSLFLQISNTVTIFVAMTLMILYFSHNSLIMEKKLIDYNYKVRNLASHDPLTGLCNRREILSWLKEKTEENSKQDGFLNIVIGDIDLFKQVNDTYGHDAGDEVLKEISEVMERFMNGKGAAARWGGEEFLLVFTQVNGDICAEQVEELRRIIEKKQINYLGQQIRITMTFGIQEHQTGDRVDHTITKADAKLYTGKKKGRNRVVF